MAPEQLEHPSEVDHRADIYALGVVFYQMLTGQLPGLDLQAPSRKVHIDVRLDEIVLKAMEKNPEQRYQQASVMKTRVDGLRTSAPAQPPPRTKTGHGSLRRWWWLYLVMFPVGAVIALTMVAVLVYLRFGGGRNDAIPEPPEARIDSAADPAKTEGSGPRIQTGDLHLPPTGDGDSEPAAAPVNGALAEQWLSRIDAGDYARSWDGTAAFFQNAITAEAWSGTLTKFRKPLGDLKTRKLRNLQEADVLPGAPDGKYVIIQFDTSFAAKAEAVEIVTFMLEEDGSWKPAGYVIR
jgi:hypothetical protein